MELRVLKYFLSVARNENISKAAEELHLTQPTLSRQLSELEEELGLEADAGELILCGTRRIRYAGEFHGRPFRDNQVSRVYALWRDVEPEALVLQAEEVESVLWMDYDRCCQAVKENSFPHCIVPEELELLRKAWD